MADKKPAKKKDAQTARREAVGDTFREMSDTVDAFQDFAETWYGYGSGDPDTQMRRIDAAKKQSSEEPSSEKDARKGGTPAPAGDSTDEGDPASRTPTLGSDEALKLAQSRLRSGQDLHQGAGGWIYGVSGAPDSAEVMVLYDPRDADRSFRVGRDDPGETGRAGGGYQAIVDEVFGKGATSGVYDHTGIGPLSNERVEGLIAAGDSITDADVVLLSDALGGGSAAPQRFAGDSITDDDIEPTPKARLGTVSKEATSDFVDEYLPGVSKMNPARLWATESTEGEGTRFTHLSGPKDKYAHLDAMIAGEIPGLDSRMSRAPLPDNEQRAIAVLRAYAESTGVPVPRSILGSEQQRWLTERPQIWNALVREGTVAGGGLTGFLARGFESEDTRIGGAPNIVDEFPTEITDRSASGQVAHKLKAMESTPRE